MSDFCAHITSLHNAGTTKTRQFYWFYGIDAFFMYSCLLFIIMQIQGQRPKVKNHVLGFGGDGRAIALRMTSHTHVHATGMPNHAISRT